MTSSGLAIRKVGAPVLRQRARRLSRDEVRNAETQCLIDRMRETMRSAPGVGLAAPQVGYPLQIVVIEDRKEYQERWSQKELAKRERKVIPFHALINPKIIARRGPLVRAFEEGCLSVPGFLGYVPRYTGVQVEAWDEHGDPVPTIHKRGWYARILQHEIDHLHGKLFLDRMPKRGRNAVPYHVISWLERLDPDGHWIAGLQRDAPAWVLGPNAITAMLERFGGHLASEFGVGRQRGVTLIRRTVESFLHKEVEATR